jgi:acetyl esterase/lipase
MAKRKWALALCMLLACGGAQARTPSKAEVWEPAAGHTQIPLWPGTVPDAAPMPGPETVFPSSDLRHPHAVVTNVSRPTMTVYAPRGQNSGAAVLVLPSGGFEILAMDLEGTEICDWLTSIGVTCVLVKYRVPSVPYDWHCNCRPDNRALSVPSLEDAQRALRLVRFRAGEWHIDPHRIGVIGFSAGGYLVAEVSTNFNRHLYAPQDVADRESSRPDFALAIYPGHLDENGKLNPNVPVSADTPPTFVLQAEDDHVDGVRQALVYYAALEKAQVPAEMHLYAKGGHAFGLRKTQFPISRWPHLAEAWMRTIGILGNEGPPQK